MSEREKQLAVLCEGSRVGVLASSRGAWSFAYADPWRTSASAFPLSPSFPLEARTYVDTAEDRRVEWYFENLLPEGGVRRALAKYANLSERDTFGLLRRFGEESAGALTILSHVEGEPLSMAEGRYAPLSREELRDLIRDLPHVPLIAAHGRAKMSLAGAQHKLGVRLIGDDFLLPEGMASSHILKPDNARPEHYPFCPANEHFVMSLAREIGLPVPATSLVHLPEPIYVVERFDRFVEGDVVRRRHQIDLCQMANKWPAFKYESDGGATARDLFAAADLVRQPAVAKNLLLRWSVFNYLVGNSDAHAKNVAFLVSPDGFDLAPFYDLLSVKPYGDDSLAMSIGGEDRYGIVTAASWDGLAEDAGVRPAIVRKIRRELARDLPGVAEALLASGDYQPEERAFLANIVAVVREHAAFVMQGL